MDKFIIDPDKDIKKEVIRIILAQVISLHEITCDTKGDINENVHEIRKRFKMIRAVVRLIRDSAGYSVYHRENIRFRDLSRMLSSARDYEVLFQNAISNGNKLPELRQNLHYKSIITDLTQKRDSTLNRIIKKDNACDHIRKSLEESIPVIHTIKINKSGFDVIEKGLRRMHRQTGKYLSKIVNDSDDPVIVHTLRKRVKYLWYQVQLLEPVFPEHINTIASCLDQIADNLGVHRDNYLFQLYLKNNDFYRLQKRLRMKLMEVTNNEKENRLLLATAAAQKFFSEPPEDFTERIGNWYKLTKQTQQISI